MYQRIVYTTLSIYPKFIICSAAEKVYEISVFGLFELGNGDQRQETGEPSVIMGNPHRMYVYWQLHTRYCQKK